MATNPYANPYQQWGVSVVNGGTNAPVVAANQQRSAQVNPVRQQFAGVATAANPYIGQTTQGVGMSNPYLGQTTPGVSWQNAQQQTAGAARNAMAGVDNPYLSNAINAASQDAIRQYNLAVAPQRQAQMAASGSFGNAGLQEMQLEDQRNLQGTLGNIATNARLADYNQQLGLAENLANRQTGIGQFNAQQGNQLGLANAQGGVGAQQFNAGLTSSDLARNLGAYNQLGMFNAGLQQNDLARNTNAALGLGTFNAGAMNQGGQFNASQGNQLGQFNAGLAQQNNQFNAGQGNQLGQFNAVQGNQSLQNAMNRSQQQGQFDATRGDRRYEFDNTLDYNTYFGNAGLAQQQQAAAMGLLPWLSGMYGGAGTAAQNDYMAPLGYLQGLSGVGTGIGGQGGTQVNPYYGNPLMGFLGGYGLIPR
jgi:hypothetical protein